MSAHASNPTAASAAPGAPLHFVDPRRFKERSREAVGDAHLRASFRGAMDFLQDKRAAHFGDRDAFERLRDTGEAIRRASLARLPELLVRLEASLQARGVHVHWAQTPDDAIEIFDRIAKRAGAASMIKGKSMVSEEVELNHRLAERGIDCLESDMGEYIVQLAGERPSHIIMPAIHKTKRQIAELFVEKIPGQPLTEDVDELIATGRRVLRERFRDTPIGVSGVNVMVADSGTLALVENEGNGRLCTTVPDVHIAIAGIEKVVETIDELPPILSLLTRSATGQAITTYVNLISGPRRAGELDGPREVHVVLLDNGRSQAWADPALRATLQCIRCGACMNHCPVYARVGGLTYGTTYPGPIGAIISPHLLGLEATKDLATASTLCGACAEVCPVRIPIPDLLVELRRAATHDAEPGRAALVGQASSKRASEALVWQAWAWLNEHPTLLRAAIALARPLRRLAPSWQGGWTAHRTPLRLQGGGVRERLAQRRRTKRAG